MIRHAFIELRPAVADDFNDNGTMKMNAVYFRQGSKGNIETKINYLTDETDKMQFKTLFNAGQIFVFVDPNEVIKIDEETILEWNEV